MDHLKSELSRFKKAWLRQLQKAYLNLLWRHGLKMSGASLELMRGQGVWGRWDEKKRRILISEELLNHPWPAVLGILGHETAHQMVSDLGGPAATQEAPHGPAFRRMGARLGLAPFYLSSTVELMADCPRPWPDPEEPPALDKSARVLEKVKKLLALSGSPVEAEAQAAMDAAARLMARHNLEALEESPDVAGVYEYRTIELKSNRLDTRLALIAHILNRHFFVETVFVPGYDPRSDSEEKNLELMGRPENTRLAEHVFHFLMERSESLWQAYHRRHRGGGHIARNSFINGLLEGFEAKLTQAAARESLEAEAAEAGFSALVLAKDRGLAEFIQRRHPRLSTVRTGRRRRYCPESGQAGRRAGDSLNFNRPVESRASDKGRRLMIEAPADHYGRRGDEA